MKGKIKIGIGVVVSVLVLSCTQETEPDYDLVNNNIELNQEQQLMRETALLVGKTLSDSKVKYEVLESMNQLDTYSALVSFSFLLGNENGLRKTESKALKHNKSIVLKPQSSFKTKLVEVANTNWSKLPRLSKLVAHSKQNGPNKEAKSNASKEEDLIEFLTQKNLQLYFPYAEVNDHFNLKDITHDQTYITYDPLADVTTNEAFILNDSNASISLKSIGQIDDDFVDVNRVFIVSPIDECDLMDTVCEELSITHSATVPNELLNATIVLTHNVIHNDIEERDLLSTIIPKIRIVGKDWLGFLATHQKLRLYRASADGKITIEDGAIKVVGNAYPIGSIDIRRKKLITGAWLDVNWEFDPDWKMSENTQELRVLTEHHFSSDLKITLKASAGLKLIEGNVSAVPEATFGIDVSLKKNDHKDRFKSELTRRYVLSTNVGDGLTGLTFSEELNSKTIDYNIKTAGNLQYYFKHYFTDL